jgi:hypothetical protein
LAWAACDAAAAPRLKLTAAVRDQHLRPLRRALERESNSFQNLIIPHIAQ